LDRKQRVLNDLLDAAKEITGSDYKTAQVLNLNRANISMWRSRGEISADNLLELQRIVGKKDLKKLAMCIM
jgi:hypothetical protein